MSRPVREHPSRTAAVEFATRQLQRRPAPEVDAAGTMPWIRVGMNHEQTITPGSRSIVEFDLVDDTYAGSTFSVTDTGPLFGYPYSSIEILEPGIYSLTYRLEVKTKGDASVITTEMNGIDWDEFMYYERTHDPVGLTGFSIHDSYIFRSSHLYGATPPLIYVICGIPAAATTNLVLDNGHMDGSYMELTKLGVQMRGSPANDNPYDNAHT